MMGDQNWRLKEKAITAYEQSDLKREDVKKNQTAANCIKLTLIKFGIDAEIDSDVFEIDGIRFFAYSMGDTEIYAYLVMASLECSSCGDRRVLDVASFENKAENPVYYKEISIEQFGQWLAKPHLCEFLKRKQEKPTIGFKGL